MTDSQKSFAASALSGVCLERVHIVFSVVLIINVIFVIIAINTDMILKIMYIAINYTEEFSPQTLCL